MMNIRRHCLSHFEYTQLWMLFLAFSLWSETAIFNILKLHLIKLKLTVCIITGTIYINNRQQGLLTYAVDCVANVPRSIYVNCKRQRSETYNISSLLDNQDATADIPHENSCKVLKDCLKIINSNTVNKFATVIKVVQIISIEFSFSSCNIS